MSTDITISLLIEFEAEEWPQWRKEGIKVPPVKEMIKKIVEYQNQWEELKKSLNETNKQIVNTVIADFEQIFIRYVNTEAGQGCTTNIEGNEDVESYLNVNSERSLSEDELNSKLTTNLQEAYKFLLQQGKNNEQLINVKLVSKAHELIMQGIEIPKNKTKAGEFSNNEKYTDYKGEKYTYQKVYDMKHSVWLLLDKYRRLINCVKEEKDLEVRVYKMFKTCSWLLFELLDLHPFCDGNGRLCRLLCSYALSSMAPFPSPIYNVWSESKKDDYMDALVVARKSKTRHPTSLTTMLIECNYFGWQGFFRNEGVDVRVETEENSVELKEK